MPSIFDQLTLRLERGDLSELEEIARRLQLPVGGVARLVLRRGLELVRQQPGALLGALGAPAGAPVETARPA